MIISFRFKNSRSFLNETFINMKAVSYKEHPEHLININNKKMIKTLAVYGANASGKTNLILALANFHLFISRQLLTGNDFSIDFATIAQYGLLGEIIPFAFAEEENAPTEMELTFCFQERIYQYGFSILNQNILSEQLAMDNHVVFSRKDNIITFGRYYEKFAQIKTPFQVEQDYLFIPVLTCFSNAEFLDVMKPFKEYFSTHINYYFEILNEIQSMRTIHSSRSTYEISENPEALNYGLTQLKKIGIPIENFIIENGIFKLGYSFKSRTTNEKKIIYTDSSSTGVMKYLNIYQHIYHLFKTGGILLIDNISNSFHPAVTKSIVDLFQSNKNQNAQLLFTTHDTAILNNQQFRRDEVAFVDMNEYGESNLYTLADIKVRSDASFSKDYLLGKYGAVPIIKETAL